MNVNIKHGQVPDPINAVGNGCVVAAPAPLDAAQPHVGRITRVITQPNICLSHPPTVESCIHSWRADVCQEFLAYWVKVLPEKL